MKPQDINGLMDELKKEFPEIDLSDEEWKTAISALVKHRPDAPLDESFKKQLKQQLMKQMEQNQSPATEGGGIGWKWIMPFVGGAFAVLMISVIMWPAQEPTLVSYEPTNTQKMDGDVAATGLIQIEENDTNNAFGEIDLNEADGGNMEATSMASGKGGAGGGGFVDERMIMPYPGNRINFEFKYTGGELPLDGATTTVYQTKPNPPMANQLLNTLNLQGLNAASFNNLLVQQITMKETGGDWPLMVSIDYENQFINLYQDYMIWQASRCRIEDRCRDEKPITKEEFSRESTFIKTANDFLKKHNISTDQMGSPYVEKYWEQNEPYEEPTYFPNSAAVVYPLMIDGQEVSHQWGGVIGLRIEVDVRGNRVSGANIPVLSLESSQYDANTKEQVLEMAAAGGNDGVTYTNPEQVVTLELDTPTKELRRLDYTTKDGQRKGIMVEMLVFPIKDTADKKEYRPYQDEIVVPVASNLYKQ